MNRSLVALFAAALALVLAGCSEPAFPRDPEGTLERARGGVLVVGVSENPPWTVVADDGTVSGDEVRIITRYAASIGATVEWHDGGESALMELLKLGELDVVVGGLPDDAPWTSHAAFTRPHVETSGPDGKAQKLVLATRLGENALLTNLERFLVAEGLQA